MRSKRLTTACIVGWTGMVLLCGCPSAQPPTECAGLDEVCTSDSACCEGLECTNGVCASASAGPQPAIPAKNIAYDLIAIHDPDSDAYNDDCIGCHGDRTAEVAQDGVTPAAHATMLTFFSGEGNERCKTCHGSGPDFLTLSAGGLREQVDMHQLGCAACHRAQSTIAPPLYAR